jgi:hypothetical protein
LLTNNPGIFSKLKNMKMKTSITLFLLLITLIGCQFSKSVKKDLISGLFASGDGLSCDDVYLTANDEKISRNEFVYGEVFEVNFNNIEGFVKENESVYPGMILTVISKTGDTVMNTADLYSNYTDGINLSPLLLMSDITVASPLKSNEEYTLNINIWDKRGKGKFTVKFDFSVKVNEKIDVNVSGVTYGEIYLFSKERSKVITDDKIKLNENTYVIFEGLSGFKEEGGLVFPGLSLSGKDGEGKEIMNFEDLFSEYSAEGLPIADFNSRISSHFILEGAEFKNPLKLELTIWDKKSEASLKAIAILSIEP